MRDLLNIDISHPTENDAKFINILLCVNSKFNALFSHYLVRIF